MQNCFVILIPTINNLLEKFHQYKSKHVLYLQTLCSLLQEWSFGSRVQMDPKSLPLLDVSWSVPDVTVTAIQESKMENTEAWLLYVRALQQLTDVSWITTGTHMYSARLVQVFAFDAASRLPCPLVWWKKNSRPGRAGEGGSPAWFRLTATGIFFFSATRTCVCTLIWW